MFKKKKAILFIDINGTSFGNLYNELMYYKNMDVFIFYPFDNKNIMKKIDAQIDILISKKYSEIYLIGNNVGSYIALNAANRYSEVKKIIISNPIYDKKIVKKIDYNNIEIPILIIEGLDNTDSSIDNYLDIHLNVSSKLNYLITMKNTSNDLYTGIRHEEVYKHIINFVTEELSDNIIHLNI